MNLNRDQVLQRFCEMSATVRQNLTDKLKGKAPYSYAADCFCNSPSPVTQMLRANPLMLPPPKGEPACDDYCFNEEVMLFIEQAVEDKLK